MANEQVGIDFFIDVNMGSIAVPDWQPVGGQRGGTLRRTSEVIDAKHKTSGAWQNRVVSFLDWGLSGDAVKILDDLTYAQLKADWRNRAYVHVRWREPNGDTEEGEAVIADLSENGPHDGVATFAIDLQGQGALTLGNSVS